MNPKKSLLCVALAMTLGTAEAVEAAPIVNYSFLGTFTMYTPSGAVLGGAGAPDDPTDPAITGSMTMDLGTGTGSATLQPSVTFTGFWWTMHSIDLTSTGPGTLHADMLIDWGFPCAALPYCATDPLYQFTTEFSVTPTAPCTGMECYAVGNTFAMIALDGPNADGIPGNPMTTGPFPGHSTAFNGTLTVTSVVPVPAAVWLFGSGLLGLLGLARRRKGTGVPDSSS